MDEEDDYDLDEEDDFYLDEEDDYDLDEEDDFYLDEEDDYDLDEEDDFYLDEEDDYDLDEEDDFYLDEEDDLFSEQDDMYFGESKRKKRKRENLGFGRNNMMRENAELKRTLKEMSTHNAKLLYTLKIINERKLSSSEQKRIVESFDNATSVKEVKRVYQTLSKSRKRGTNLRESASNPIRFNNVYRDGLQQAQRNRIQQLAGL